MEEDKEAATSDNISPCFDETIQLRPRRPSESSISCQEKSKLESKWNKCWGWICVLGFLSGATFASMAIMLWNVSRVSYKFEEIGALMIELQSSLNDSTFELERSMMVLQNSADNHYQTQMKILRSLIEDDILQPNSATSCSHVLQLNSSSPSGHYWIKSSNGSAVHVYCDFNRQCGCNGSRSWTRVAFLNMSDPNQTCPCNWTTISSPVRTCGRERNRKRGCNSVFYSTFGLTYSRVCGCIIAYQDASTDAFQLLTVSESIDGPYVDGVSLTHGSVGSRQHIWTFASALGETDNYNQRYLCNCSNDISWPYSTDFVGNDYFCDSGNHANTSKPYTFYSNDPLWDSHGCGPSSACCQFNNPPWFCKTLPQFTTDDLEVRICHSGGKEDTPIQLLELYIQ